MLQSLRLKSGHSIRSSSSLAPSLCKRCNGIEKSSHCKSSERTALDFQLQYSQKREKGKEMNLKYVIEQFKRLAPITQIALIIFVLIVIVLVMYDPVAGSSIIA